ncbi:MAG: tetratricopeptide repeat protein [Sandaracinaceae bacterium]|nr:tetratricopeptide repeat protein [Sandaracinaceae bacterium]
MIAVVLVILCAASPSSAQRASESVLAREQFRTGVAAAREGRWDAAAEAFQRSYELSPRPLTLLNLAGAYAQTGHLVESVEAYRMFLMERQGVTARMRTDAEAQLADLEPRIPRARIRVLGIAEGDVVRLDEYELSTASLEQPLPVNPGDHTVLVQRGEQEPIATTFTLEEGQTEDVLLDARPLPPPTETHGPDVIGTTGPTTPARPITDDPVFWIVVVGAAVVVGGVVTGVVLATQPGPTTVGNLPPGQIAID